MAQRPTACTALAETLNLIPSIHGRQFATVSNCRGSLAGGGSILATSAARTLGCTHLHSYTHIQAITSCKMNVIFERH